MDINAAIDFFMLMFNISLWALGFIMIAYFLAIVKVMLGWVQKFKMNVRK